MSEVLLTLTEFSTESCLSDMPYEILFEIFRRLPKGKLFEMTKLCSQFSDVAWDARLWKDVYIKYKPITQKGYATVAFEKLYSKPVPVKIIDLSGTKIVPPVSLQTDQAVKVTKLNLSSIYAVNDVTLEAILAKYQCTELYLEHYSRVDSQSHIMISPEAFSKQTSLKVLSLRGLEVLPQCHLWLEPVLSNCKNLRSLDLGHTYLANSEMLSLVQHLPTSLETLWMENLCPGDSFFKLLLERIPNLRELELGPINLPSLLVTSPSIHKFQFLETLRVSSDDYKEIADFSRYFILFPALRKIYLLYNPLANDLTRNLQMLQTTLEPHDIIVQVVKKLEFPHLEDCHLWEVS